MRNSLATLAILPPEASTIATASRLNSGVKLRRTLLLLNGPPSRANLTLHQLSVKPGDLQEHPEVIQATLRALRAFSESLRRNRPDGGDDPKMLSRADLAAFANDLSHLEAKGQLSPMTRRGWVGHLSQFLTESRAMGLSRPGGPLADLAPDVGLRRGDKLKAVPRAEPGRALPQTVMDQLLDPGALERLEATHGPELRAMVELQAAVGRRTGELCGLRHDCLAFDEILDEAGQLRPAPVLVHDMPKVNIRGYRLPIRLRPSRPSSRHRAQTRPGQRPPHQRHHRCCPGDRGIPASRA